MQAVAEKQKLTQKQQAVYNFIRGQIVQGRKSPTVREISEHFNIRSSNGVLCHLRALERKGWIKRDYYLSRGITLVSEPYTQIVTLSPGQAGCLGELYVGCVKAVDGEVTLELIGPDTAGEFVKDK